MEDVLQVGMITSTHGVRGEVKVFPTTDDTKRFKRLKKVFLDTGKEMLPLQIENVKFFKNMVILKFEGLDNVDDVVKYRQKGLYVERKDAVKLQKDEYFIADLIDTEVFTEEGIHLGRLTDVITTGANDVYAVMLAESSLAGENVGKEILIPAIRQCILDVDIDEKNMTVHLLEGLLDI
ncbi:MAG: ribosome maturation factor RimM [Lachnospiraceae bacterium]|nr:ribosome maturation factor RimM [Lachnospiraceae bacterium]